jgi:mRNA interferase RelE/StbE
MAMPSSIEFSRPALQRLKRIPEPERGLIRAKIAALAEDRRSQANNVRLLQGYDGIFRLRVGDWRIIYRDDIEVLRIIDIDSRQQVYGKGRRKW